MLHPSRGQRIYCHGKATLILSIVFILAVLGFLFIHPIFLVVAFLLALGSGMHLGKVISYSFPKKIRY